MSALHFCAGAATVLITSKTKVENSSKDEIRRKLNSFLNNIYFSLIILSRTNEILL